MSDFKLALIPLMSLGYRCGRQAVIIGFEWKNRWAKKNFDFEDVIQFGDKVLHRLDCSLGPWVHEFPLPEDIGVYVYDLYFPSPLVVSSFKDDPVILNVWLKMGMGGVITKTLLEHAHFGNPRPRIVDLADKHALINAMGLPGPGVEGFAKILQTNPPLLYSGRPIGISLGGRDMEEYQRNLVYMNRVCDGWDDVSFFFEFNISCPNTKEGQDMCRRLDLLKELLDFTRQHTQRVVGVKLSPDQSNDDLVDYAHVIASFERTYVNLGNTQYRHCETMNLPADTISVGGGGLSGAPLFPRTLEMVRLVSAVNLPIMATGGVSTPEQVYELQKAGAILIGMATALVKDPYDLIRLNYTL